MNMPIQPQRFTITSHFDGFFSMPPETITTVKHFGVEWNLKVRRKSTAYRISFTYDGVSKEFPLTANTEMYVVSREGRKRTPRGYYRMHDDFDPFSIECDVEVYQLHGYPKLKLMTFDSPIPYLTDAVLLIGIEKFHVSKVFLATHSPVFKNMFFGPVRDTRNEIPLHGIHEENFQDFLELLHCHNSITPHNIEGLLVLSNYFDVKTAKTSCENFLIDTTAVRVLQKLTLADEFRMTQLQAKCKFVIENAKTVQELHQMCPEDISKCSENGKNMLLTKMFAISMPSGPG